MAHDPRPNEGGNGMRFTGLMIGSDDPQRLADYYGKVLGAQAFSDGGYTGFQVGEGWVTIGPHSEVHGRNGEPGRIMWNMESDDVRGDFDRMRDAGASVVREPYTPEGVPEDAGEMLVATFEDPDGNYFQLMSPMGDMST